MTILPSPRTLTWLGALSLAATPVAGAIASVQTTVPAPAAGTVATPASSPAPDPGANRVDVRHWAVRGNTALTAEELDQLIGPSATGPLTVAELRQVLFRLRDAYRARGFLEASVRAPRQRILQGTVILEVSEGPGTPGTSPLPGSTNTVATNPPTAPQPAVPPPAEPRFEVRRYDVSGNTLLTPEVVESAFTNALGNEVTFTRIQQALGNLQLAYRERGYATVAVGLPQQQLTNATVKVEVTEGVLTDIRVTGNQHFSSNNVLRALPSLRTGQVLNSRVFQRELDLANQNRDRQIFPTLLPGPEPGSSALNLRVQDRLPLHGRLEVNNHSTPGTPEWRINTSANHNNLWQLEHQIGVSYSFSPEAFTNPDLLRHDYLLNRPLIASLGAYYRLPIGEPRSVADALATSAGFGYDEATRQFRLPPAGSRPDLSFFASTSSSDTGIQFGPLRTVSETPLLTILSQDTGQNVSFNNSLGTRFSLPIALSDSRRLALSAGVDWKSYALDSFNTNNFIIRTVVTNAQGSQVIESRVASPQPPRSDEVQYLPLVLAADYASNDPQGSLGVNVTLSGNVLGDSEDFAALAYSRRARNAFARLSTSVLREQKLPGNWSLGLRAAGQVATGPMISNEQFALGGVASVRGYYEGDQYGDGGWLASAEIRTPFIEGRVPTGSTFAPVWLRALAFLDGGQRYLIDTTTPADSWLPLLGTGFGVSANINNHVDLRLVVGWPVFDTPATASGEPQVYLTLGGQF